MSNELLRSAYAWKRARSEKEPAQSYSASGALREYVAADYFELTVSAPVSHDVRTHCRAYEAECHTTMQVNGPSNSQHGAVSESAWQADAARMKAFEEAIALLAPSRVVRIRNDHRPRAQLGTVLSSED